MKFQDDISNMNTHTHTHTHTYGQAKTNMPPLFQSWGHSNGDKRRNSMVNFVNGTCKFDQLSHLKSCNLHVLPPFL